MILPSSGDLSRIISDITSGIFPKFSLGLLLDSYRDCFRISSRDSIRDFPGIS